ncbi:MAG TPA: peptidylprolyl isomerase, partial [Pirellulaceae bacterium]|nr:peptidylprolyl isomerase [Pirellulaceae bacterium]
MKCRFAQLVAFLVLCLAAGSAVAQDPAAEFNSIDAEWTKVDDQIGQLIKQYRTAPVQERQAIVNQYNALVEQSKTLMPKLREATIAAYQADPKADARVEQRLVGLVGNDVRHDDYEGALALARMLTENGCKEPALDAFVGVAAYCVDDFETAETLLKKAEAANVLTPEAQVALQDLPTAKQAWLGEQAARNKEATADDLPRVKLETNRGTLVIELYENEAPQAVGNFVSLVESGFYDGL